MGQENKIGSKSPKKKYRPNKAQTTTKTQLNIVIFLNLSIDESLEIY